MADMPSRSRSLNPDLPLERFALELRDLHRQAGRPKQRLLASAMHCSHATVSAILNGHRFPSWEQTEALVLTCGGDIRTWKNRWAATDRALGAEPVIEHPVSVGTLGPPRHLSGREFYRVMLAEVNRARFRIMTTFIRHRPPEYFLGFTDGETAQVASAYFESVVRWSALPGPRSVRRIICTPNAEMREWAQRFVQETATYPRHEIRVVDWPLGIDAVNMAIFDDSVVLLAFTSGAAQQLNGFRIDEPEFVRCSVGHFEQLWSISRKFAIPSQHA
ncbi:helix-turn-helix domain-containing protein [Nonomuraea endophytica]|uniref:helix-turn-helix domain-containing protein n=1 Tax=Nonomuraea endophytica TaxID=714136 RepID=UPI0037C6AB87